MSAAQHVDRPELELTCSALHFTAAMADREQQTEALWEDLPLPDQFPEPHTQASDETNEGRVGGTEESIKAHPQQCSPNLLLMLKAAEGWRTPHARDGEQGHTAAPHLPGEAHRAHMVSGMETLEMHICEQLHGRRECACNQDVNDFLWKGPPSANV